MSLKYKVLIWLFFLFLFPVICSAKAEVVTFKSWLVWRIDTEGDYLLPKYSSPGRYELAEAIQTDGEITSITANWKFKGKVILEVSVDNGLNYIPVVNCVPVSMLDARSSILNVSSGNQIKWRVLLGPDSELTEIRIAYTDTSGVAGTFGNPSLSGFQFRKPIYIRGPSPQETVPQEELFNYQMKIRIGKTGSQVTSNKSEVKSEEEADVYCQGNIRTDFKDIRFTAADGETLLPYYRERLGTVPAGGYPFADFWVKIPQIPEKGLVIYLYYGNPEATDLSCGEEVFDFFDDFKDKELDREKWEIYTDLGGSYQILDSQLKLDAAKIITKNYQINDGIIEYQTNSGYESRAIIRAKKEAPDLTQLAYSSNYKGAEHSIVVGDIVKVNSPKPILLNRIYDYRLIAQGEDLSFTRYSQGYEQKEVEISLKEKNGLDCGYIGLESVGESKDIATYYDLLRVRKYVKLEPKVDSTGIQEATNLAQFAGIVLAKDGNLVLDEGNTKGSYVSKLTPASLLSRILIPNFSTKGSDLKIDISADGGENYVTDCRPYKFYYASRGDFVAGNSLGFRVRFHQTQLPTIDNKLRISNPQVEELNLEYRLGDIVLVYPNGGEDLQVGRRSKILWIASGYEQNYPMRIEYSLDGGRTYNVIKEKTQNIGAYFWRVPKKLSNEVIIKISDAYDPQIYDTSDQPFKIKR